MYTTSGTGICATITFQLYLPTPARRAVRILIDGFPIYECAPVGTVGSVHCYLRIGTLAPGRHELEVCYATPHKPQ